MEIRTKYLPPLKEVLVRAIKGEYMINGDNPPTQNHQIFEEVLEKQREFGAMIRFQRDLEGRYL